MRVRTAAVVVASLAALVASDVLAQPGGGRRFGGRGFGGIGYSRMALTQVDKVRDELKITDDQRQQLVAARDELRESRRGGGGFGDFQSMSREERQQAVARFRAERVKQEAAKLGEVLNEDQLKRLDEVYVQVENARALTDPKVAEALNISPAQLEEIQAVQRDARSEMFEAMQDLRDSGTREEMRAKMQELQKASDDKVMALLSDSQKDAFAQMKGEPLELTQDDLSQARARRGGRGGGAFGGQRRGNRGGGRPDAE